MTLIDFKTSGEAKEGSKARTTSGGLGQLNFKCPERPFLRFKGEIHAKRNKQLRDWRKITPKCIYPNL